MIAKNIRDAKGQSTVEYILLLGVVVVLVLGVIRSQGFQEVLGKEGTFFRAYKSILEFNYQHGFPGSRKNPIDYSGLHPSYSRPDGSRFFIPLEPYPET